VVCSDGFYTLYDNETSCNGVQKHASCTNGLWNHCGWWILEIDITATDLYACYNVNACISGYEPLCATGYGGNLCQSCKEDNDTWYFIDGPILALSA